MAVGSALTELAPGVAICEVEISDPPAELDVGDRAQALVIAKLHGHVLGSVLLDAGKEGAWWLDRVREGLDSEIVAHLRGDGALGGAPQLVPAAQDTPCQRRRARTHCDGPWITAVIATRGRPEALARCLDALLADRYPRTRVVVVDNAPPDERTEVLVKGRYAGRVRYTREARPGLAVAHNHGLGQVETPLVAFTDDDVVVDPWWLTSIVAAFADHPHAAAVTGMIVPDELETESQVLLERHGSFGKGADKRVFDLGAGRPADPLFPFTAGQLGSGANMAFRCDDLRALGGFDPALGTGTPARGGDDLAALFAAVAAGRQVVYEPTAMVRHRHHRDLASLSRQSFGYGVGLGAFLTGAVLTQPRLFAGTIRHLPYAAHYAFSSRSERNQDRYDGWPSGLAWRERAGLVIGPLAYLRSRLGGRRVR